MKLKAGVIGVGKLGRFHAEKYLQLSKEHTDLKLVGVFDQSFTHASTVASELGQKFSESVMCFESLQNLLDSVDVVTIATPSHGHGELVMSVLQQGKHCLVEKPLALGLAQGSKCAAMAKEQDLVLAVGHSERYNPVFTKLKSVFRGQLKGAEFLRHSPYAARVTDVSVIDDLMIHDLDLLFALFGSDFKVTTAKGHAIRSSHLDAVVATLVGANNAVVQLSSSRLLPTMTRTLRVWSDQMSAIINFQTNEIDICQWDQSSDHSQISTTEVLPKQDHLMLETRDFIRAVNDSGFKDYCSGEQVLPALAWRDKIAELCQRPG